MFHTLCPRQGGQSVCRLSLSGCRCKVAGIAVHRALWQDDHDAVPYHECTKGSHDRNYRNYIPSTRADLLAEVRTDTSIPADVREAIESALMRGS